MTDQLVARIKRSSKYWGQTLPNQWFEIHFGWDDYPVRGNNNRYRLSDVALGVCQRSLTGVTILDLSNGKREAIQQ